MDMVITHVVHEMMCNGLANGETQFFEKDLAHVKPKVKSDKQSYRLKDAGNRSFHNKFFATAIEEYTQSLGFAASSEAKSYAYANRSAALFHKGLFKECVQDIDTALGLDYPKEKRVKLHERRTKAMVMIDQKGLNQPTSPSYVPEPSYGRSPEMPCVSSGVSLRYSTRFGRHLVATRNFKPGDVLLAEKAYFHILETDFLASNCKFCLRRCSSMLPCETCPNVFYCSSECRKTDWDKMHSVECSIWSYIDHYGGHARKCLYICLFALNDIKSLKSLEKEIRVMEMQRETRKAGFNKNGHFIGDNYKAFYSLYCMESQRSPEHKFIASIILRILATKTIKYSYLSKINQNLMAFLISYIADQLSRVNSNMNVIYSQNEDVGCGIYAVLSLINHSCHPNAIEFVRPWGTVVYTRLPIKTGDQIFVAYGGQFQEVSRRQRQTLLKAGYEIDCQCVACKRNWPVEQQLPNIPELALPPEADKEILAKVVSKFYLSKECQLTPIVESISLNELFQMLEVITRHTNMPSRLLMGCLRCIHNIHTKVVEYYTWPPAVAISKKKTQKK